MSREVDALELLLQVNKEQDNQISEELITACYKLQKKNQFEEFKDIESEIKTLVEAEIKKEWSLNNEIE